MSERVQIVVPGDDPAQIQGSAHLERLRPYGDVELFTDRPSSTDEQLSRVHVSTVIMNTRGAVKWYEDTLKQLPDLELIATCSIGTDMIDIKEARELGITVCNQPGKIAPYVAEHIIGLMFAVAKRGSYQTEELRSGRWSAEPKNIYLRGKTIGLIGTGNTIGRSVVISMTIHTISHFQRSDLFYFCHVAYVAMTSHTYLRFLNIYYFTNFRISINFYSII